MNVIKQTGDQDSYPGTHIIITSDKIGKTEICRQQHKTPFHKQNLLKDHFLLFAVEVQMNCRLETNNFH
jgi:hypothetical protein